MHVIRLADKFAQFTDHWNPRVIGELNDQHIKIARVQGDFIWHNHAAEDELFMVVRGQLLLDFRDGTTAELNPGELLVVPRGTDHRPHCAEETWIMLIEPKSTVNTGNQAASELTRTQLEQI